MKNFFKVLIALLVVLTAGFLLALSQVNTERNKQAIQTAVRDATGYELVIGGDLSLSVFPSLGLFLNDIRARNPAFPRNWPRLVVPCCRLICCPYWAVCFG